MFLNLITGIVINLAFAASEKDAEASRVRQQLVVQKTTAELMAIAFKWKWKSYRTVGLFLCLVID